MERLVAESRLEELVQRTKRLQDLLTTRLEQRKTTVESLLLESVDVTQGLVELTRELLKGHMELRKHLEYNSHSYGDDVEAEEILMMCPYCHHCMTLSHNELKLQQALCPQCHARLPLYSPS
jgi:uncharacterized paraquat-inducible protein A